MPGFSTSDGIRLAYRIEGSGPPFLLLNGMFGDLAFWDPVVERLQTAHPDLSVHAHAIEGHPSEVLVEASRHAALLVVASRGHGSFSGMVLGSVSQHCVTHAACPVVVFRKPDPAG